MQVTVYGPLRAAVGGKEVDVDFSGGTVEDALEALVDAYPRAERFLYAGDGSLRPSVRVTVDGERVDPGEACDADADVTLMPAVQGGDR